MVFLLLLTPSSLANYLLERTEQIIEQSGNFSVRKDKEEIGREDDGHLMEET